MDGYDTLPAPLVEAGVELKDFLFTPLYRARLFGSEFHAHANDAEWRAGVTLWMKSWDQTPAGSLPNDEISLCRLAEFGKNLKSFQKISAMALHGWVLCSDGRLYHSVVAEGINEAWKRKQAQRDRTKAARAARHPTEDVTHPVTHPVTTSVTDLVTASKRQGQYKRQRREGTETTLPTGSKEPERESRAREAHGQEALSQRDFNQFEISEDLIAEAAEIRADAGLPEVNLRAEAKKFWLSPRTTKDAPGWLRWSLQARSDLTPPPNGHDPPAVYKPDVPDGPPPPFVWPPPEDKP